MQPHVVVKIAAVTASLLKRQFCETDSAPAARIIAKANTPPLHRRQPFRQSGQRYPDTSIVRGCQALEGAPVHPLGLGAVGIRDARRPAQTAPYVVSLPPRSIVGRLPLARIRQAVAVATSVELPVTIENCDALTAGRADPPAPHSTIGACSLIEDDRLLDVMPTVISTAAVLVDKDDALDFHPYADIGDGAA